jgi:predicted esterase
VAVATATRFAGSREFFPNRRPRRGGGGTGAPALESGALLQLSPAAGVRYNRPMRLLVCCSALIAATLPVAAAVLSKSTRIGKTNVEYKVVLPDKYDAAKAYPGVLAFPGGPQTMSMVENVVDRNWREQAEKRGYIVVVPAAPNDELFFEGGEHVFPEFITHLLGEYRIQNNKLHIAGVSNGGISAFYIAAKYPQYFVSITGYPGYLPDADAARLSAISKMCINMYAGELDEGWAQDMEQQARQFKSKGMNVRFSIEKGQPHIMATLAGAGAARLFDFFDQSRNGCGKQ